jgi:hypothetical protein
MVNTGSESAIARTSGSHSEFTVKELILLSEKAPEVYRELMREKQLDQRHRRRIAWAPLIGRVIGNACGLIALSLLAAIAWHAFDLGDATQAAAVICTGAVSIVAVFVTGRFTSAGSKQQRKPPAR